MHKTNRIGPIACYSNRANNNLGIKHQANGPGFTLPPSKLLFLMLPWGRPSEREDVCFRLLLVNLRKCKLDLFKTNCLNLYFLKGFYFHLILSLNLLIYLDFITSTFTSGSVHIHFILRKTISYVNGRGKEAYASMDTTRGIMYSTQHN